MRQTRRWPSRLLGGVCVAALGASLCAAGYFHREVERTEREIAALHSAARTQAQVEADRSAQDRAHLEQLGGDVVRVSAERDRAMRAVVTQGQTVAEQQQRIENLATERERLTAERETAIASAMIERAHLTAEREAVVDRAAVEQARLEADGEAALERAAGERDRLVEERHRALVERDRLAEERDRAVVERDATMSETRSALHELDAQTRNAVADVEKIILATGLEPARLAPEPNRMRRVGARGGPYIPWKEQVALAEHGEASQFQALNQQLERLKALHDVMVRLPLIAPVTHAILSDGFGYRYDPVNGRGARHDGLDLRAVRDSAVYATAAGTVIAAGWDGAFGNLIQVDHGFGVISRYAHLSRMLVRKGDVVAPREQIGVVGATGRVTGTHLHYEIWIDGQPRDPMRFLDAVSRPFAGFTRQ